MDNRRFLGKIRKLQDENKGVSLSKIVENTEDEQGQDISKEEQRDEENAFKKEVSQLTEFKKIKVFKKTVKWSGRLIREGINWSYTLDDKVGCFIYTNGDDTLQLTDDMIKVIKSIRVYYDVWSNEWGSRLTGSATED